MKLGEWIILFVFMFVFSVISGLIVKTDFKKLKMPSLKFRGKPLTLRGRSIKIPGRSKEPYLFEIVTLQVGANTHEFIRKDKIEFKHEEKEIKKEELYLVKPGIFTRIKYFFRGIKIHFLVLFLKGKKKPLQFVDPAVTPGILNTVDKSKALSQAIKDEFKKSFDFKIIFFIIAAVVIGGLVYVYMRGQRMI